jgi:hypothetical protein
MVGLLGGSAWAQEPYCSVEVGDVHITITDPIAGTANANATCVVTANFPATITPTVEAETGFENPANNHWVWIAKIDGNASKDIPPDEESVSPINVAVSGVTLSDPAILTFTKVATVTVTITEDESKSFLRPMPLKQRGKAANVAWRPIPIAGLRKP